MMSPSPAARDDITFSDKTPLEAVQRKGLALCLNLPNTAGREAMEVVSGVTPLDLRLEEIAVRELAKIQAKKVTHPFKKKLEDLLEDETTPTHVSPLALAYSQAKEVEANTSVSISLIEPEFDYEEVGSLYRSRTRPEYWSRLGSSKSRTSEKEDLGRETILDLMMETPQGTAFAFTDGSCISNPGPCGAGAILYPSEREPVLLKRPVSRHGSILLAELVAILMVLEYVIQYPMIAAQKIIRIFSDSQTAVGVLTMGWKSNSHRGVILEANKALNILSQNFNYTIELLWTPGHAGLQGNEKADQLAKEGGREALEMPEDSRIVTIQEVKDASRKTCLAKWQSRWENSSTGRRFYEFYPTVNFKRRFDFPDKHAFNVITQLQTGYSKLNDYRSTTGQKISPLCECGSLETPEHFLLECELYADQRDVLARDLQKSCGVPALDIHTLLGNEEDQMLDSWREVIQMELAKFIKETGRFAFPDPAQP